MNPEPLTQQPVMPKDPLVPLIHSDIPITSSRKKVNKKVFFIIVLIVIIIVAILSRSDLFKKFKVRNTVMNLVKINCADTQPKCNVGKVTVSLIENSFASGKILIDGKENTWIGNFNGAQYQLIYWSEQYPKCNEVAFIQPGILGGTADTCFDGNDVVNRATTGWTPGNKDVTYDLAPGYSIGFHIPTGFSENLTKTADRITDIQFRDQDNNMIGFGFSQYFYPFGKNPQPDMLVEKIGFTKDFDEDLKDIKCHASEWFPLNQSSLPRFAGLKIYITSCNNNGKTLLEDALKTIKFSPGFVTLLANGLGPDAILFDNPSIKVGASTYVQAKSELMNKLKDFPTTHASETISKEKVPPVFAAYEIIGDKIYRKDEFVSVSPAVKTLPEYKILSDTGLHLLIAEYVRSIIPEELLSQAHYLYLSSDGQRNSTAWVGHIDEYNLALNVDILDLSNYINSSYNSYMEDLTHESIHLLQYKQVNTGVSKTNCKTYYISDWGCSDSNAYMTEFYNRFWKNKYPEGEIPFKKADGTANWDAWEKFYSKYPDQFVTVYAVSNPVEDFAESLRTYIWDYQPGFNYPSIIGAKFAYFESTQGLKRLRETYHEQTTATTPVPTGNQGPTSMSEAWGENIINSYNIPIYPKSTFGEAEYYPECTKEILEGSCENNRVTYRTTDTTKVVAKWYFDHTEDTGWKFYADNPQMALDNYVTLMRGETSILLHIWDSGAISGTGPATEIVFDSLPNK